MLENYDPHRAIDLVGGFQPSGRGGAGHGARRKAPRKVQDTRCDSEILRRLPMLRLFVAAGRAAGAGQDERLQAVVVTQHGGTQL